MAKTKKKKKKSDKPTISEGDHSKESNGLNGNRIYFSMSKTINIGNYESIRVEYGYGMVVNTSFERTRIECEQAVFNGITEMVGLVEEANDIPKNI